MTQIAVLCLNDKLCVFDQMKQIHTFDIVPKTNICTIQLYFVLCNAISEPAIVRTNSVNNKLTLILLQTKTNYSPGQSRKSPKKLLHATSRNHILRDLGNAWFMYYAVLVTSCIVQDIFNRLVIDREAFRNLYASAESHQSSLKSPNLRQLRKFLTSHNVSVIAEKENKKGLS